MKCEDDVEDVKVGAGNRKGESDEYGVEDDAEFEDEECSHLCSEVVIITKVVTLVAKVAFTSWRVAEVISPPSYGATLNRL